MLPLAAGEPSVAGPASVAEAAFVGVATVRVSGVPRTGALSSRGTVVVAAGVTGESGAVPATKKMGAVVAGSVAISDWSGCCGKLVWPSLGIGCWLAAASVGGLGCDGRATGCGCGAGIGWK